MEITNKEKDFLLSKINELPNSNKKKSTNKTSILEHLSVLNGKCFKFHANDNFVLKILKMTDCQQLIFPSLKFTAICEYSYEKLINGINLYEFSVSFDEDDNIIIGGFIEIPTNDYNCTVIRLINK